MSDDPSAYMTCQDVADLAGIKRKSVWEQLSRGELPEPDLVWMRHPLWLPETIKDWRDNMHGSKTRKPSRRKKRKAKLKRSERIKVPSTNTGRPPRIAKPSSNGASVPVVSAVSEQIAKQIAAALRADGHHATTADVMNLSGSTGEDDHERDLLRQRVQAKLRGLKARER
jgi:hypothetical protein